MLQLASNFLPHLCIADTQLHRLGRDYPDENYNFNMRLRRAFESEYNVQPVFQCGSTRRSSRQRCVDESMQSKNLAVWPR